MVCLRLKPRVAGWKAQTNPLSQGGTPVNCLFEKSFMIFFKNLILALQARKMFAQTSCPLYTSKVVTDPYLPTYLVLLEMFAEDEPIFSLNFGPFEAAELIEAKNVGT